MAVFVNSSYKVYKMVGQLRCTPTIHVLTSNYCYCTAGIDYGNSSQSLVYNVTITAGMTSSSLILMWTLLIIRYKMEIKCLPLPLD